MLTVAYCRVSTEEQAAEGYSIDGQAEKLRAYADLHDLGEVVTVSDPGLSGKDTNRPGLQQVLDMVEAGHVAHVLVWRLDRLSRSLGDLILLADQFGQAGVGLHSFTERIDLSSATGRMFYNVLGAFAQFYREQLAENVTMGMAQARSQGQWINRPPTGYSLHDGLLIPNDDAPKVRRAFEMRANGKSQPEVAAATGIKHSTLVRILDNRAYLGEMRHKDQWFQGIHEPLISAELFEAAHRGRVPGRRRGKDLMSSRVLCGLCGRHMSIESNGKGQSHYRCRHRGEGCDQPARSNRGVTMAAVLAMQLLCDEELRTAIRRHLDERRQRDGVRRRRSSGVAKRIDALRDERSKLLRLHYEDRISPEQFGEEQARLTTAIENLEHDSNTAAAEEARLDDLAERFDQVAEILDGLDIHEMWEAATEDERRTLLDELLQDVTVHPDRLVVTINGAPPLNVAFSEVGLKDSELSRVGGGT